ncbi:MAG TPA: tetratricopeptide repeat protein [Gammaproteobacteria bacterium]|nr:tetratricopeptide repeat protein [Gammaproteobacteria bacterium]HIL96238.1 tetratricopeptide repeat protein [Pseudomonadales bacterium]
MMSVETEKFLMGSARLRTTRLARRALFLLAFCLISGCDTVVNSRFADYFLTKNQQGRYAFERHQYQQASDSFTDPMWRGVASYNAGRYEQAATDFAQVRSANALFNMGNALIGNREYAQAIMAFEQALEIDKAHQGAQKNLELTAAIIIYLNQARQEGGTEVGADEYRFDNTTNEGLDTVINEQDQLRLESAEQWMRTVDTRPRDFLRTRFALEATR